MVKERTESMGHVHCLFPPLGVTTFPELQPETEIVLVRTREGFSGGAPGSPC